MIRFYIVREVSPDAVCSYPRGRTMLNTGPCYDTERDALTTADCYNYHCHINGVKYVVVGWDEGNFGMNTPAPFPADRYEKP